MPDSIDSLQIEINATADKATSAIDVLAKKLDKLSKSLASLDFGKLQEFSNSVQQFGTAMQTMNNVDSSNFKNVTSNLAKLSKIDTSKLGVISDGITEISKSFGSLSGITEGITQITEFSNGIKQLGYKSVDKAIDNMPKLATSMKELMKELSKAPKVSRNIIDMTNALAKLARTGASSGKAAQSLSTAFDGISKSSVSALGGIKKINIGLGGILKRLAPLVGLVQLFNFGKESIEIASNLTEVQNVVDTTFGNFKQKIEDLSSTSIMDFGMSEYTAKQIGSTFQAMGGAMGFAQGEMADMSVELVKLTGDMASFYDVAQEDVGKSLQSIFTGETEPLRKYGLDLTQATLEQWALNNGINASVSSMSQLEKAQLRYQYVMANTGAAQGDFAKTMDSWSNQVRILKQQLQQLASVIGGTLINALKPLVKALNSAMSHIVAFAKTISNALGKIFGWTYEEGAASGVASDFESAESSAGGIADSTGKAAKNIDKMKKGIRVFDELKTIESNDDSSSGGGSSGGGSSGGGATAAGGQWTQAESILKSFESEIDSLYELGAYIGKALTDAMNSIDWKSIYEKARGFGTGLAEFLNGLISPELFGAVGRTIASALNTAIYAALSFGETFDWENLGLSIAEGINEFFATFDFASLAETINVWVQGIWTTIWKAFKNIKWGKLFKGLIDFIDEIDLSTVFLLAIPNIKKLSATITKLYNKYNSLIKYSKALVGAFTGNKKSIEILKDGFPKLGKAVDVVGDSFQRLMFGIHYGDWAGGINSAIKNIRDNLTGLQKGVITAISGFAEFKIVSSSFEDIVLGSENVVASIAKIGGAVGIAAAAMYTALGPAGIAIAGITGVIAAFKGIEDAEQQLIENSEIEKYGDTISNITERINETSAAIKNRANEAMEYVETAGIAEISMASDLADKYFDLAEKENLTNQEKLEMKNLATALIDTIPGLQDYYNEETGLLDVTREGIDSLIQSRLQEIQLAAIEDKLKEAYEQQYEAISNLEQAIIPANDAQERMNSLNQEYQDIMSKMELLAEYERLSEQINLATGNTEELSEKQKEVWNELTNNGADSFPTYDSLSQKLAETTEEISGFAEKYEETMGALAESKEAYDLVENNISTLTEMLTNGMTQAADNAVEGYANGIENGTKLAEDATRLLGEAGIESMERTQDSHSPSKEYEKLGKYAVDGYNLGFSKNKESTLLTISTFVQNALNKFREIISPMYNIGLNAMQGIYNGLSSMESSLYDKARSIADNIANTIKKALDIHSPSRVMAELGEYTIEGFKVGMENLYSPTLESLNGFSYDVESAPTPNLRGIYESYQPDYASLYNTSYSDIGYSGAENQQKNAETNALLRELLVELRKGQTIELDGGVIAGRTRKIANNYTRSQGKPYFDY